MNLIIFLALSFSVPIFLFPADKKIELQTIRTYQSEQNIKTSKQTWSSENGLKEIIQTIDTAINKKYQPTFLRSFSSPNPEDCIKIINTMQECYSTSTFNITDSLINELMKKNKHFTDAIAFLVRCAFSNMHNVTPSTLKTVEDLDKEQPILALNQIPLAIKLYVMKRAQNKIDYSYDISLQAPHYLLLCDICHQKDFAIIYQKNGDLIKCDLHNNSYAMVTTIKNVSNLAINPSGTQLALATYEESESSLTDHTILIWDLINKIILNTIPLDGIPVTIGYITNDLPYSTLYVFLINFTRGFRIFQWNITHEKIEAVGVIPSAKKSDYNDDMKKYRGKYTFFDPKKLPLNFSSINITKDNCASLYLCFRAFQSARSQKDIDTIRSSSSYASLTSHEQDLLNNKMQLFPKIAETLQ